MDVTILEYGGAIAEDEINCSGDQAVDVELTVGMGVKGVLVCQNITLVECG